MFILFYCLLVLHSFELSKEVAVYLKVGEREEYIFLPPINIQITQTGTQEMICIQKKKEERLHGTFSDFKLLVILQ
jgi:hypothetical protein